MNFGNQNLIADSMRAVTIRQLQGKVSNEAEDVSGRTSAEIEQVLYARVTDFEFLERAAGADRQEQWSVKVEKTPENAGSGSIRVRKVVNLREAGAATQYILATKLDVGDAGGAAETPEPSTVDQFNIFKYLANKGMLKDRYYFPIEGSDLQWEVDCFTKPGSLYHDWIKIDLEKWPRGRRLPELPFKFAELINGSEGEVTEENKAKISQLYDTIFLTKNVNTPLSTYDTPEHAEMVVDEEGQNKENDTGAAGDTPATEPPTDDASQQPGDVPPEGDKTTPPAKKEGESEGEGDQANADGQANAEEPNKDDGENKTT